MGVKNEDQNITLAFNSSFPFFAPKSITKPVVVVPTPLPTNKFTPTPLPSSQTQLPTDIPPSATATPSPTSGPTPSVAPSPTSAFPTDEPTPTPQHGINNVKGASVATYPFTYDENTGNMTEDDKHCFGYNRLNQLTSMKIKKDSNQRCSTGAQFKKLIYFYYDASGILVLQEEYDPKNDQKPVKQTYYIGSYEEEYTN